MTNRALRVLALLAVLALLMTACDTGADTGSEAAGEAADAAAPSTEQDASTETSTEQAGATEATGAESPITLEEGAGEGLEIGLVTINLQALFFNQINEGAQRVADEYGANLEIFNANNDPIEQNNAIENFTAQGVDALVVLAIDTEGIVPAIQVAADAGVPVIAVDAIVESDAVTTQVGTDNELAGRQIGEFLVEQSGGEGQIGIVGALNSTIQNTRQAGFEAAVTDAGMEVVNVVDGRNIQEEALAASENLLTGNPELPYAYATGEPALVGLLSAVQSQGRTEDIEVVGWDISETAVDALEAGYLIGMVQQDTFRFGEEGMRAAIAAANGQETPAEIPIDVSIVTPENYEDYLYYLED